MRSPSQSTVASRPIRASDRAFTLVELLVVIAIISILITLVVVVSGRAFKSADKTRLGFQLRTITTALEAYKTDFGSFPTTSLDLATTTADNDINAAGFRGARTLCKALMGPVKQQSWTGTFTDQAAQDGAEGFGFRVPPKSGVFRATNTAVSGAAYNELAGKVYGPYLAPDQFPVAKLTTADGKINTTDKTYDDTSVLLDANGNPILYYPVLNPQPTMTVAGSYIKDDATAGGLPMYRFTDNNFPRVAGGGNGGLSEVDFKKALGDKLPETPKPDGAISAGETAAVKSQFLLWSAGPDGFFGTPPNAAPGKAVEIDDVKNFGD